MHVNSHDVLLMLFHDQEHFQWWYEHHFHAACKPQTRNAQTIMISTCGVQPMLPSLSSIKTIVRCLPVAVRTKWMRGEYVAYMKQLWKVQIIIQALCANTCRGDQSPRQNLSLMQHITYPHADVTTCRQEKHQANASLTFWFVVMMLHCQVPLCEPHQVVILTKMHQWSSMSSLSSMQLVIMTPRPSSSREVAT